MNILVLLYGYKIYGGCWNVYRSIPGIYCRENGFKNYKSIQMNMLWEKRSYSMKEKRYGEISPVCLQFDSLKEFPWSIVFVRRCFQKNNLEQLILKWFLWRFSRILREMPMEITERFPEGLGTRTASYGQWFKRREFWLEQIFVLHSQCR